MSAHSDLARKLFKKGYNCSQSVFAAFCDETGLDTETALKIASSFGGGMGRLREVCGAVTGMFKMCIRDRLTWLLYIIRLIYITLHN